MEETIAAIVVEHGRFVPDLSQLQYDTDLFEAGLTSHASAVIMTVIENDLGVTFPDHLLTRSTFHSVSSLAAAVEGMLHANQPDAAK